MGRRKKPTSPSTVPNPKKSAHLLAPPSLPPPSATNTVPVVGTVAGTVTGGHALHPPPTKTIPPSSSPSLLPLSGDGLSRSLVDCPRSSPKGSDLPPTSTPDPASPVLTSASHPSHRPQQAPALLPDCLSGPTDGLRRLDPSGDLLCPATGPVPRRHLPPPTGLSSISPSSPATARLAPLSLALSPASDAIAPPPAAFGAASPTGAAPAGWATLPAHPTRPVEQLGLPCPRPNVGPCYPNSPAATAHSPKPTQLLGGSAHFPFGHPSAGPPTGTSPLPSVVFPAADPAPHSP